MEQPKHIEMQTPNGTELNLDALYKIAPSCFTEAKGNDGKVRHVVDFNKLRLLLGDNAVEDAPEVYDFTWVGKRAALQEAAAPINKTLRPCPEESVDWDKTQNLYIEGDNLEVLKLLQNSYMGKVKMIYIDPPYNTGNDFVYHDDLAQSVEEYDESNRDEEGNRYLKNTDSNGRFHSDWCSMIYARLMIARNLLTDDGVIFISIDDNEQRNLKNICDEVFGEVNLVMQIAWRRTDNQSNIGMTARVKEYILIYAKNVKCIGFYKLPLSEKAKKEYQYKDDRGLYGRGQLREAVRGRHHYDVITPNGFLCKGPWLIPKEEFDKLVENDLIHWPEKDGGTPRRKIYLRDMMDQGQIPNDYWGIEFGTNQRACSEVDALFNKRFFDFPKPVLLLYNLLKLGTKKDSIILDFFSGSATTAHAVMKLNSEDGGNRKFIMVQLPEETADDSEAYKAGYKNICEIGKERIRRAGKKIKEENPLTTQDLDTGFRVFKCDSSNYKDVAFAPKDYNQGMLEGLLDNIKEDRTDLDLLFDCMLRWGVELSLPLSTTKVDGCTIHNVNDGDLVACFDGNVTEAVIDAIADLSPLRVVFRDNSFNEAAQKMNLFELFKQKCDWTDEEVKNNVRVI